MPTDDKWLREHGYILGDERAFQDVAEGEEFTTREGTRNVRMPEGFDPDWPLANARQVGLHSHLRASFGPWAAVSTTGDTEIRELLTSDPHTIQHALADHHRGHTGRVPRGQLWQPCKIPGCDDEPVCMNCMCCEKTHCCCFD